MAGGHLTPIPVESIYFGVISLRGACLLILLSELNDMNTWPTDIRNVYLKAHTKESVYLIVDPEVDEL